MLDGHFVVEHGAPQPLGPLLQLQRHRRHLAPQRDRRRRRLAARHAHRGPRPLLPRAAARLALRLPAGRRGAGRAAGRDERLQDAAAPLGQGLGADAQEAACRACSPRTCPGAMKVEATFHLTANLAYPADGAARRAHVPGDGAALQHGLGRDDRGRRADLPGRDRVRLRLLRALARRSSFKDGWKRKLRYIPAVLGDRASGSRSTTRKAVIEGLFGKPSEFARTPKYGIEGASDDLEAEGLQGQVQLGALRRAAARLLLHLHLDLRDRQRPRGARCRSSRSSSGASSTPRGCPWRRATTGSCRASRRPEGPRHRHQGPEPRRPSRAARHAGAERRRRARPRWWSAISRAASRWWRTATTAWSTARTT